MKQFSSKDIYVGQGVCFGDLIDGQYMEEYKRTECRLFIGAWGKELSRGFYLDPTTSKRYLSLANEKPLKEYIPNIPETVSAKLIENLCKGLNGKWFDNEGKINFVEEKENKTFEKEM